MGATEVSSDVLRLIFSFVVQKARLHARYFKPIMGLCYNDAPFKITVVFLKMTSFISYLM